MCVYECLEELSFFQVLPFPTFRVRGESRAVEPYIQQSLCESLEPYAYELFLHSVLADRQIQTKVNRCHVTPAASSVAHFPLRSKGTYLIV